jgi:hypothetical protein
MRLGLFAVLAGCHARARPTEPHPRLTDRVQAKLTTDRVSRGWCVFSTNQSNRPTDRAQRTAQRLDDRRPTESRCLCASPLPVEVQLDLGRHTVGPAKERQRRDDCLGNRSLIVLGDDGPVAMEVEPFRSHWWASAETQQARPLSRRRQARTAEGAVPPARGFPVHRRRPARGRELHVVAAPDLEDDEIVRAPSSVSRRRYSPIWRLAEPGANSSRLMAGGPLSPHPQTGVRPNRSRPERSDSAGSNTLDAIVLCETSETWPVFRALGAHLASPPRPRVTSLGVFEGGVTR